MKLEELSKELSERKEPAAAVPKSTKQLLDEAVEHGSVELVVEIQAKCVSYQSELASVLYGKLKNIQCDDVAEESLFYRHGVRPFSDEQAIVMGTWLHGKSVNGGMLGLRLMHSVKSAVDFVGPPSFRHSVDDALSIEASGDLEGALDALFAIIDAMFKNGRFDEVDQFISSVAPSKFSVEFLIGLLTATLIADDKLQHRSSFYEAVRQYFETAGEPTDALLFGLDRLPE